MMMVYNKQEALEETPIQQKVQTEYVWSKKKLEKQPTIRYSRYKNFVKRQKVITLKSPRASNVSVSSYIQNLGPKQTVDIPNLPDKKKPKRTPPTIPSKSAINKNVRVPTSLVISKISHSSHQYQGTISPRLYINPTYGPKPLIIQSPEKTPPQSSNTTRQQSSILPQSTTENQSHQRSLSHIDKNTCKSQSMFHKAAPPVPTKVKSKTPLKTNPTQKEGVTARKIEKEPSKLEKITKEPLPVKPEPKPGIPQQAYIPWRNRPSLIDLQRREEMEQDIQARVKEILPKELASIINFSNGIAANPPELAISYKFYLSKGNNSQLIKIMLDERRWWTRTDKKEQANFVWTCWRDPEVFAGLPRKKPELQENYEERNNEALLKQRKPWVARRRIETELENSGISLISKSYSYLGVKCPENVEINANDIRIYNKFEGNNQIANKKNLYFNMLQYYNHIKEDIHKVMPLTFLVKHSIQDESFQSFEDYYNRNPDNIWILKPGENSNRGTNIEVKSKLEDIQAYVSDYWTKSKSMIIQKYIKNPLLIHNRKFDIRCFSLMTSINGNMQGYFYQDGYLRTSCKEFTLDNLEERFVHLTNDAIQIHADDYGKFENGNKLSYTDFQKYLDEFHPEVNFYNEIYPQIKNLVTDTMKALHDRIDPNSLAHCFEVFGYDFMVDTDFQVWLIEVNTNPCLDRTCVQLARIIPSMLDNAFRIAVDPLFPEPYARRFTTDNFTFNKFELVFNEFVDGEARPNAPLLSESESEEETEEPGSDKEPQEHKVEVGN